MTRIPVPAPHRRANGIATRNGRPAWEQAPPRQRGGMAEWLRARGITLPAC